MTIHEIIERLVLLQQKHGRDVPVVFADGIPVYAVRYFEDNVGPTPFEYIVLSDMGESS